MKTANIVHRAGYKATLQVSVLTIPEPTPLPLNAISYPRPPVSVVPSLRAQCKQLQHQAEITPQSSSLKRVLIKYAKEFNSIRSYRIVIV